jgi:uncharacterized protein YegP (UPF0339 family)
MKIEVYRRGDGKWAWRVRAANGQVVATDGAQGYSSRADAAAMALRVTGGEVDRDIEVFG